ncbi:MAG: hypothetical protein G01um101416_716 [Microgenomates group bacterium Gr01-1014_16]|nr:MAG: hypothetical protein G01um101416_716 [Microgenomates group bacterium Gr01-1014_16]
MTQLPVLVGVGATVATVEYVGVVAGSTSVASKADADWANLDRLMAMTREASITASGVAPLWNGLTARVRAEFVGTPTQ